MKVFYAAISIMLLLCLYFVAFSPENADFVADADEDVAAELKALVIENLRATRAEDLDAMLDTLHSESPSYSQIEKIANTLFETYDLNYDLLLFRYIGQDGEYAIARFKFSTEQVAGPEFNDNILDTIHVFREENGMWKIWSQAILEIEFN